mgnify:CR=1 FL=1
MTSPLRALYPAMATLAEGWLDVGDGHEIYWKRLGTAGGIPAVILHGGPGGGLTADEPRMFDPSRYDILTFDQRGCGWCRLRTGMGVRSISGMARMRKPLDGHRAVVARMQRLVHPAQGGHKYEGQQQAGQPDHLPCARTGTRAHGGARTLVGPWQRQAHGR